LNKKRTEISAANLCKSLCGMTKEALNHSHNFKCMSPKSKNNISVPSWYLRCNYHFSFPGAHFLKALETFQARKAIFSSFVSKNREVYRPETSCMKGLRFCYGFPGAKTFQDLREMSLKT